MLQTQGMPRPRLFTRKDLAFLGIVSACGFALGLVGIYHYGYIAQDFVEHRDHILSFPGSFSYAFNNPPGLFWFGSLVRHLVGPRHFLEAIALSFLIVNTSALWIFYGFLWRGISAVQLRYSAAAFATFVPFRVIHAVVLAADGFTLPIFVLVALFTLRLFEDPRARAAWVGLSLSLCAGMLFKYTFVGVLPPVALLMAVALWRRLGRGERLRWSLVAVLALALPTEVLLFQVNLAARANSYLASGEWLSKGALPPMRWSDMLLLQRSDLGLLSAPDYFAGRLYVPRNYSYPGLVHVASFTDVQGSFQPPAPAIPREWDKRTMNYIVRTRTMASEALQEVTVSWTLIYSVLAVAGTLGCAALGCLSLVRGKPLLADSTVVLGALAVGFYLPVFLSLHRLNHPYTQGFWLPRLVLPALLVFFSLGFVLLDVAFGPGSRLRAAANPWLNVYAAYTLVACLLFIGFLS